MLNPASEIGAFVDVDARGLMGEIGADISINENDFAIVQRGVDSRFGLKAIAGVEKGGEMRVHSFERAKVAIKKLPDHLAKPGVVLGKACGIDAIATGD